MRSVELCTNVGDVIDELSMQRYIIVPALSAVDPKIDPLEALLVSTVAKQAALKANLDSFVIKAPERVRRSQARQLQTSTSRGFQYRSQGPLRKPQNQQSGILTERSTPETKRPYSLRKSEFLLDITSQESEKGQIGRAHV